MILWFAVFFSVFIYETSRFLPLFVTVMPYSVADTLEDQQQEKLGKIFQGPILFYLFIFFQGPILKRVLNTKTTSY